VKPKLLHQEAMDFSFRGKQALEEGRFSAAFELYKLAADLESQVAQFYFDKPDLEPTRSALIRSAAFLNLKAGLVEEAKRFIFFGLLNTTDIEIKAQLNNALELAVSLSNMPPEEVGGEFNYLNLLRQRSIHYVIEPATRIYGKSVSLEMIRDFTDSYLKSLKAFALAKCRIALKLRGELEQTFADELEKVINPLVTSSAYGSFKFSIANDFLAHASERPDLLELKANVVTKFHTEIFANPLSDEDIGLIKKNYQDEEINEIFRPLTKIKSNSTPYKIAYFDPETFEKKFAAKIVNKQKKKLITVQQITQEDIGQLESSIIHTRNLQGGRISRKTIIREQLKSYEFGFKTNIIEPSNAAPLILNEEIVVTINFDSGRGFTFAFEDFRIAFTDIEFNKAKEGFYNLFNQRLRYLANLDLTHDEDQGDWEVVTRLIGNTDALKD
jgi:hypothetical protein